MSKGKYQFQPTEKINRNVYAKFDGAHMVLHVHNTPMVEFDIIDMEKLEAYWNNCKVAKAKEPA